MWPKGVTATVRLREQTGTDGLMCPTYRETATEVAGVLVAGPSTSDLSETRPEGTSATLRVHMPRSWAGSLYGATIDLPEPWGPGWRVVGDPQPQDDSLLHDCPWNVTAEVRRADG